MVRFENSTMIKVILNSPCNYYTSVEILETFEFIRTTPLNKVQVFLPVPYPGTKLWHYAIERSMTPPSDRPLRMPGMIRRQESLHR